MPTAFNYWRFGESIAKMPTALGLVSAHENASHDCARLKQTKVCILRYFIDTKNYEVWHKKSGFELKNILYLFCIIKIIIIKLIGIYLILRFPRLSNTLVQITTQDIFLVPWNRTYGPNAKFPFSAAGLGPQIYHGVSFSKLLVAGIGEKLYYSSRYMLQYHIFCRDQPTFQSFYTTVVDAFGCTMSVS